MIHESVKDVRSGKIVFLSHCCLNQNAKVRGIAKYPGAIRPLVEIFLNHDIGIFQMTCPEMTYVGAMRWGYVRDQYNSPMFRKHCLEIASETLSQAEEYARSGYDVLGFVMMDGSPVCGLNNVPQPAQADLMWGGMCRYIPDQVFAPGQGVFCEILKQEIEKHALLSGCPFVAYPEEETIISYEQSLEHIRDLVR